KNVERFALVRTICGKFHILSSFRPAAELREVLGITSCVPVAGTISGTLLDFPATAYASAVLIRKARSPYLMRIAPTPSDGNMVATGTDGNDKNVLVG